MIVAALILHSFVSFVALAGDELAPATEADFYAVDYLTPPEGVRAEVGGLGFLPDGRLVASTRRGQVWIVENPLAKDPKDARFHLFAEGLYEGLGLAVVGGVIHVVQRGELSRLLDEDGDGACDRIETVSNDWGVSGHYHEYAYGLPRDAAGNFFVSLNVSFGDPHWWHGRSTVPYRGWVMKIAPDGTTTPFASGLRSPCGLGTNAAGDLFVTDNQGDWMAACPIFHLKEGAFYGHPASLNWTDEYRKARRTSSDTTPPDRAATRERAAAWIPYDWSRSAGSVAFDPTTGKFGPLAGQMFVAELTNGMLVRAALEKVRGEWQGAVMPFRRNVGSAIRVAFAEDGTLFAGLTERGWGGRSPGDGIARVRWTGRTPLEMESVKLLQDGFEIAFTLPLAANSLASPAAVEMQQYDYNYWWEYGSPRTNVKPLVATSVAVSPDRKKATVRTAGLEPGTVVRLRLPGVAAADGTPLLHDEAAYTINELPEGPPSGAYVAKLVPPPPPRDNSAEGVLYLTEGDPLDAWKQEGWAAGEVRLDPADATRFMRVVPAAPTPEAEEKAKKERNPLLDNLPEDPVVSNALSEKPTGLLSRYEFGDCDVHVDFQIPKGGNSGVYLMGRYEVQILDSSGKTDLSFGDCGGIYQGWGEKNEWAGRAPNFNAFRGPGQWHGLDIRFRAPRFDASGKKIANATFARVMIDDVLLQEEVEVPNPTRGALFEDEAPLGPLFLQGDHGPVAFTNVRVRDKRIAAPGADRGWTRVFDGKSLEGWKITDGGAWRVEDGEIVGTGARSHLFSPRGDYRNFEFRAQAKINAGGNSGMYFRVAHGPGWPAGYEAQVNSSNADLVKTGSFYAHALVKTRLVPNDTWFTQHVTCRDEEGGTRVVIRVNGVVVVDHLDTERKHASGHIAFQQHHEGSEVRYRNVEVRELP